MLNGMTTRLRADGFTLHLPEPVSANPISSQKIEEGKPLSQSEVALLASQATAEEKSNKQKGIQIIEKLSLESSVRLFEHFRDQHLLANEISKDALLALSINLRTPRKEIGDMILNLTESKLKKEDVRFLNAIARCGFDLPTELQKNSNELYADPDCTSVAKVEKFRDAIANSIKLVSPGANEHNEFVNGALTDTTTLTLKDGRKVILGVERGGFFAEFQLFDIKVRSNTPEKSVVVIGTFKEK